VVSTRETAGAAEVTVNTGDTLSWLLYNVYGRADTTVVDFVQTANPSLDDVDVLRSGQRLRFPAMEPASMVYKRADGRYFVHLLTTPNPQDSQVRRLRTDIANEGRRVRMEPVHLGALRGTCYRVWVGDFSTSREAEAFYRRMHPEDAA
jgi:phage tail protein X